MPCLELLNSGPEPVKAMELVEHADAAHAHFAIVAAVGSVYYAGGATLHLFPKVVGGVVDVCVAEVSGEMLFVSLIAGPILAGAGFVNALDAEEVVFDRRRGVGVIMVARAGERNDAAKEEEEVKEGAHQEQREHGN